MIKYNLKCHNDHEFESWFSNSEEFEKLNKKKLLECIFCSSKNITKSIMAPMVSSSKINNEQFEIEDKNLKALFNHHDVENIFSGPGFLTITKKANSLWENIIQDLDT